MKTIYTAKAKSLFEDKDLKQEQPISTKELDRHLRKLKKLDKLYEELVKDLDCLQ